MSELGDLLELLYRSGSSWRTLRLLAREWTHVQRTQRAYDRYRAAQEGEGGGHVVSLYAWDPHELPRESNTKIRMWATADGRRRIERSGDHGSHTIVFDGKHFWTHTPEFGAILHESRTMQFEGNELLDSVALIGALELTVEREAELAGRRTVAVRGRPRRRGTFEHAAFPPGADEVLLLVDAERGIVLRNEALLDGEPVRLLEVAEIAYDEELPDETFAYEPPPGETVRTQDEAFRIDHVSVEEAAQRASFTVWLPDKLAPGWRVQAIHRPASERPKLSESVHLLFHDDAIHSFTIEQAAERLLAWRTDEPEVVQRGGIELRVLRGSRPGPPSEVHLEHDGTHLRLSSDSLDADGLVELAAALVPASPEPPRLLA